MSVDEPSEQSKSVADARAVEGLCYFRLACFRFAAGTAASPVVQGVKQSKSVADARAVEGPALFVDEPSELLESVADARAVEGPALSVDEPSEQSKSVADTRALEGLCFFSLACLPFAQDKAASPMVHDVKQSKSIAYARVVEGPALFVE